LKAQGVPSTPHRCFARSFQHLCGCFEFGLEVEAKVSSFCFMEFIIDLKCTAFGIANTASHEGVADTFVQTDDLDECCD